MHCQTYDAQYTYPCALSSTFVMDATDVCSSSRNERAVLRKGFEQYLLPKIDSCEACEHIQQLNVIKRRSMFACDVRGSSKRETA